MSVYLPTFTEALTAMRSHGRNSNDPDAWNGLRLCMTGLQGGGKKWKDVSGFGNHGTLTNMDPATDWVIGGNPRSPGHVLKLVAASTQYIRLVSPVIGDSKIFSIAAWFRMPPSSGTNILFSQYAATTTGRVIWYAHHDASGGVMRLFWQNQGELFTSANAYDDGQWHFAVLTCDGTTAKNYVDGVLDGQGSIAGVQNPATANTVFGQRENTDYFEGDLGTATGWNRPVLPSEIQHLYERPLDMFTPRPRAFPATVAAPPAGNRRRRLLFGAVA